MADNRFSDMENEDFDVNELEFEYDDVDKVVDFSVPEPEEEKPEIVEVSETHLPEYLESSGRPKRKAKKKWGLKQKVILGLVVVLTILLGITVFASLVDSRPHKIKVLSAFDFSPAALDKEEEETFLGMVSEWDSMCMREREVYRDPYLFPPYSQDYIASSYGADSLWDLVNWFHDSFAECGDKLKVSETYKVKQTLNSKRELKELQKKFREKFWSYNDYDILRAYVITVYTKVKGSEGSTTLQDDYLFYLSNYEWNIILIRDLADFGL